MCCRDKTTSMHMQAVQPQKWLSLAHKNGVFSSLSEENGRDHIGMSPWGINVASLWSSKANKNSEFHCRAKKLWVNCLWANSQSILNCKTPGQIRNSLSCKTYGQPMVLLNHWDFWRQQG